VVIALDRQERGTGALSAVQEVTQQFSIPVVAIMNLADLMRHMSAGGRQAELSGMRSYRERYGIAD
jgi:orotate phosphoribosyltransferase